jgi:hypothetical protein
LPRPKVSELGDKQGDLRSSERQGQETRAELLPRAELLTRDAFT